jgi:hypothetical protein
VCDGDFGAGFGQGWRHCWSPKWKVREVATADSPVALRLAGQAAYHSKVNGFLIFRIV